MAIIKQYTIEVRGEFEPQNDIALRTQLARKALEMQTLAKMLAVYPSQANVCMFSDDFFAGHSEVGLNAADVPEKQTHEIDIDDLEITIRMVHAFKNAEGYGYPKIEWVSDLLQYTAADLLRLPNFGKVSLREIREVLANMGLSLKGES